MVVAGVSDGGWLLLTILWLRLSAWLTYYVRDIRLRIYDDDVCVVQCLLLLMMTRRGILPQ